MREKRKNPEYTKRKGATVVDGTGAATHVLLPRITATLTTAAGLLLATECATNLGTVGGDVDVHDTTV